MRSVKRGAGGGVAGKRHHSTDEQTRSIGRDQSHDADAAADDDTNPHMTHTILDVEAYR